MIVRCYDNLTFTNSHILYRYSYLWCIKNRKKSNERTVLTDVHNSFTIHWKSWIINVNKYLRFHVNSFIQFFLAENRIVIYNLYVMTLKLSKKQKHQIILWKLRKNWFTRFFFWFNKIEVKWAMIRFDVISPFDILLRFWIR